MKKSFRSKIERREQTKRAVETCKSHGIALGHENRCTAVTSRTITKHFRMEVAGNTFAIKDTLKSLGFKWDGVCKVWWNVADSCKGCTVSLNEVATRLAHELS